MCWTCDDFNPRSPHGERHPAEGDAAEREGYFNPRSPHGERRSRSLLRYANNTISIHAPRTGSDNGTIQIAKLMWISIHAPRTGSDRQPLALGEELHISIHAPRTGSDHSGQPVRRSPQNFNPRSPHGERREGRRKALRPPLHFNPRSPHGERLDRYEGVPHYYTFQSTLPARGAT